MRPLLSTLLLAALLAVSFAARAQDKPAASAPATGERVTPIGKFILDSFRSQSNRTLCSVGDVPVSKVEERVLHELGLKAGETVGQDAIEKALWKLFPCPFSPYRPELIPAGTKDVEGVWLFPHESQPYRYGALSPLQPKTVAEGVSCEALGFYAGGEMRSGRVPGANSKCPFLLAADLDPARKRPRVQNWSMVRDGQLKVTRNDLKDYVEDWDVFQVTKAFQALNMEIRAGDLVAFKRREKGLDPNISTEYMHLQRLP